jgi:hypothetical protein
MLSLNSIYANDGDNYVIEDGGPTLTSWGGNLSSDNSMTPFLTGTNDVNKRDPLFVDPFVFDYHLMEDSPCIDKGIPGPDVPEQDLDGNDRVGNPDMGCYEYQGTVATEEENDASYATLKVSPNPASNFLMVEISGEYTGAMTLLLVDPLGRKYLSQSIEKFEVTSIFHLNTQKLPVGVYYLSLLEGNQILGHEKLFVVR